MKRIISIVFLLIILIVSLTPVSVFATNGHANDLSQVNITMSNGVVKIDGLGDSSADAWNNLFDKYRGFIVGISGVGAITMIVLFIIQFMKLGASAGNPQARTQALTGVLWTGLATCGLGAVVIIVGFFYHAL